MTIAVGIQVWAWLPLSHEPVTAPSLSTPARVETPTDYPELPLDAFDVALWAPPPAEQASESANSRATPPSPGVTLELVGVIREGNTLCAALYDPGAGKLVTAREGETIAGHEITSIDLTGVQLSVGGRVVHLPLNQDRIAKAQTP